MSDEPTVSEFEKRIAVVRQNIAGLVEQAVRAPGMKQGPRTGSPNKSRSLPG
jgi:hypothetical protein